MLRNVSVSTIEADLPTPSRTLDTLNALSRHHPDAQFRLVVGADILEEVDQWYRWDEIERLAPPLVVGRAGNDPPSGPSVALPAISSTEVRAQLARGVLVSPWLPTAVSSYIEDHGLYR